MEDRRVGPSGRRSEESERKDPVIVVLTKLMRAAKFPPYDREEKDQLADLLGAGELGTCLDEAELRMFLRRELGLHDSRPEHHEADAHHVYRCESCALNGLDIYKRELSREVSGR